MDSSFSWDVLAASCTEADFLDTTRLVLSLLHNVIQEPGNERMKRLRANSKFLQRPGVVELLENAGFEKKDTYYVLSNCEDHLKQLRSCMREIVSRRRGTGNPLGWDVPSAALHFSKSIGYSKYGDILQGNLDGQEVAIKTLKPDASLVAKESFERELSILSHVSHPQVVRLVGATLLAEPTSLILELLPHSMLNLLHHSELCDVEVFRYARQVAMGMEYLHSQKILHCDLAARNLLVSAEGEVKISDFSYSQLMEPSEENVWGQKLEGKQFNIRWSAPEVLRDGRVSKESDVWGYGVLLYEFVTAGSVPYANFSNIQVQNKVLEGYRLSQPLACLDDFYSLMIKCWTTNPEERPQFHSILSLLLNPMEKMLSSISDERPLKSVNNTIVLEEGGQHERKMSKKCKVKESSYQAVVLKGGGLLRIYTALVAPFQPRVTVVCSKKTTMTEVIQLALAKCGKSDLDHRSYAIALLDEAHQPVKYIGPDDKVMSVKGTVSPSAQFVLCIRTPEKSLLEVVASIRQNPSYRNALDTKTKGYLVKCDPLQGKGGSLKPKNCTGWQRYWCVLDGSSLLCYDDEEDEGVKQFDSFLDFTDSCVSLVVDKKNNNFKVESITDHTYLFTSSDRTDALRWIEAIESSVKLDPSPLLLQSSGGAVVHTAFITCHRLPLESQSVGRVGHHPLKPLFHTKLGDESEGAVDETVAVSYGKLWSILRSSGLVQCMVDGKPQDLVNITKVSKISVTNPLENEATPTSTSDYFIRIETQDYVLTTRADTPTDHYEWVFAFEGILRKNGLSFILVEDKSRHSGYVALKRLLSLQGGGGVRGSELVTPTSELQVLQDLYGNENQSCERASPDGCEKDACPITEGPPVPPRGSSAPPPPLPPREPPPLPPKRGNSLQRSRTVSMASTLSNSSGGSMEFDEYVVMQPPPPSSLKFASPTHNLSFHNTSQTCSIPSPITESEDYMHMKPVSHFNDPITSSLTRSSISSPPISIPGGGIGRRSSTSSSTKRCVLLRSTSDIDGGSINNNMRSNIDVTPPLPPRGSSPRHVRTNSSSSSNSLSRNSSSSLSSTSFNGRVLRERTNGSSFSSALLSSDKSNGQISPFIPRSNSTVIPTLPHPQNKYEDTSVSDGLVMRDVRDHVTHGGHAFPSPGHTYPSPCHTYIGSVSSIHSSENGLDISGLSSLDSSTEDITQPLPDGWERAYSQKTKRYFYFNADLGLSKWNYDEVLQTTEKDKKPGPGWNQVSTDDGRTYYYHENTRQTTWDLNDTLL